MITTSLSARILGIVPTPSYSHQIVYRPLWRELSSRGHQVTVITTDPMNDTSLTNLIEISLHFSYETWNEKMNLVEMAKLNVISYFNYVVEASSSFSGEQLQHFEVQSILTNATENYELVLIETFYPAMVGFAEKFNCSLIQIFSLDNFSYMYRNIGNPAHPILNPEFVLNFPTKLNFFQRITSTFISLYFDYYYYPNVLRTNQLLITKHFGDKHPTLEKTLERTRMMFVNTDTIFHRLRPLLPSVIQFGGGTHLTKPEPLPKVQFLLFLLTVINRLFLTLLNIFVLCFRI